jgi:hypothetical protein
MGSIPASNYIQMPLSTSQSLGLVGYLFYMQFRVLPGRIFIFHVDVVSDDGVVVRLSFSSLFKVSCSFSLGWMPSTTHSNADFLLPTYGLLYSLFYNCSYFSVIHSFLRIPLIFLRFFFSFLFLLLLFFFLLFYFLLLMPSLPCLTCRYFGDCYCCF